MSAAPELRNRVAELMADAGYAALLGAVRARLEAHGQPATITLRELDAPARDALADLLGRRRRPDETVTVRVDELDRSLRASRLGAGLIEVLEAAGGPLADRRGEARRRRDAWAVVHDELADGVAGRPELEAWVAGLRADGLLVRLGDDPQAGRELGTWAAGALARLPADGVPLSVLAAEVTGDPHALDPGQPLATLVLRGVVELAGGGGSGLPDGARARRRLWSEVGVVCDPLSASVLVLGLRSGGFDLLAGTLTDHAAHGEPVRVTLRQLVNTVEMDYPRTTVSICENPAVMVAAADTLAERCAPLLCTEGVPDAAADRLLRELRAAGCDLRFHADFDGGGLRIGNLLHGRYGAVPWRMSAADYERAVEHATATAPLRSVGAAAGWDPNLAPAMRRHGRTVAEEQVLDTLLPDLDAGDS